jgi:REP element-mobilizing transposase RayT
MEIRYDVMDRLLATVELAASKHGHRLSRAAILPDHIHLTLGCEVSESPEDVVLGYLNNCAYVQDMKPIYKFGYYVGTFGEYDRGAVL